MKKILGLDLGTNSVGFALIQTGDSTGENKIIHMGSRIVPKEPDFHGKFEAGALGADSKNAKRRVKRGIRRGYERRKGRRNQLAQLLQKHGLYPNSELLLSTNPIQLYGMRARAVTEKISLPELGRVLILLNQKRGFKSNRKANNEQEEKNETEYKQQLNNLDAALGSQTIGQYLYDVLRNQQDGKVKGKTFYRQKYVEEFDAIWKQQAQHYPTLLTGGPGNKDFNSLYSILRNDVIFKQRPLKSAKGLVNRCRYELHHQCIPVSSPLFQHFRIWKTLNDLEVTMENADKMKPTQAQKEHIFQMLHDPKYLDKHKNLTSSKILDSLNLKIKGENNKLNFESIPGNKTFLTIKAALEKAGIEHPENLRFTWKKEDEKKGELNTGLMALWHLCYSVDDPETLIKALSKTDRFGMNAEQAKVFIEHVGFPQDYGSLSARAIRKLLPSLEYGMNEYDSAVAVNYEHSDSKTKEEIQNKVLEPKVALLKPNELRNPVVEQILNQAFQVVNALKETYGEIDEVVIEMARELRATAKQREKATKNNRALEALNKEFEREIAAAKGTQKITARDRERFKLWMETKQACLYSGKTINKSDVFNGKTEIEHIIPRSIFADDSLQNKILVYKEYNEQKGNRTALDYIEQIKPREVESYRAHLMELLKEGNKPQKNGIGISSKKFKYLQMKMAEIPNDFATQQLKDTEYITKEATKRLKAAIRVVRTSSGSITSILRNDWGLNDILKEINLPRYAALGKVKTETRFNYHKNEPYEVKVIEGWSKRDDHRHHAIDALVVALTTQGIITKMNTLNSIKDVAGYSPKKQRYPQPIPNLHAQVKNQLEHMLISYRKSSKAISIRKSQAKRKDGSTFIQTTVVPRGPLHEDTILGKIKRVAKKPEAIIKVLNNPDCIVDKSIRYELKGRLQQVQGDIEALKKDLKKNPMLRKGEPVSLVKVFEVVYTKRVEISENITPAQIEKILDKNIREKLIQRLDHDLKNIKTLLKGYKDNPIYLDEARTKPVFRVSIEDNGTLEAIRKDENGNPKDYAYLKNNHHALIHQKPNGDWVFRTVSLWEAAERGRQGLPIVDRSSTPELKFVMSMQNNDLFFRIPEGMEKPEPQWFTQPENRKTILQNLFRVQKMSLNGPGACDIKFRSVLETQLNDDSSLRKFTWDRLTSNQPLKSWIKIQLNPIGHIVLHD
jgi:CRISPR-associated endonuclease Csn1